MNSRATTVTEAMFPPGSELAEEYRHHNRQIRDASYFSQYPFQRREQEAQAHDFFSQVYTLPEVLLEQAVCGNLTPLQEAVLTFTQIVERCM